MSPAFMLFGRTIKDHLPQLWSTEPLRPQWSEIRKLRELAMAKRHIRNEIRFDNTTRTLPALQLGDTVLIQNQTGPKPNRWSKTGRVVEDLGHRQFHIKIDGSNRITLRNRKFLKRILPVADTPQFEQYVMQPPIEVAAPSIPHAHMNSDLPAVLPGTGTPSQPLPLDATPFEQTRNH